MPSKRWTISTRAGLRWSERKADRLLDSGGCQAKGDDRIPVNPRAPLDFFQQYRLQVVGIGLHLACRNFLVGSALKTKFANAKTILRTDRGTEYAASHGTRFIQLAHSSFRIEHRARLVVGEIRKPLRRLVAFIENATRWIAGEIGR